ncbi:hypothetical protein ACLOJK_003102 [Asimina triloba]
MNLSTSIPCFQGDIPIYGFDMQTKTATLSFRREGWKAKGLELNVSFAPEPAKTMPSAFSKTRFSSWIYLQTCCHVAKDGSSPNPIRAVIAWALSPLSTSNLPRKSRPSDLREGIMLSSALFSNSNLNFPPKFLAFPPKAPAFTPPPPAIRSLAARSQMTSSAALKVAEPSVGSSQAEGFQTLMDYVGKSGAGVADDLAILIFHLQYACKRIAAVVASPFNSEIGKMKGLVGVDALGERDAPKPLDIVSNDIILSALRNSGKVSAMASEEDAAPVWISDDGPFVVVTDPLDGSRNIDASIPTGTIFGIYKRLKELDHLPMEEKAHLNSLQSGQRLIAAGYVLYSSATIFCVSFGSGTQAFTLDHSTGDFVLTHPGIKIPPRDSDDYGISSESKKAIYPRPFPSLLDISISANYLFTSLSGQIYSVNDARYFDWPEGLRRYIDTVRQGKGKFPKKYSARYICSLVADFHRTLMYGGVVMNPRDHLRIVYEANPLSFLVEQAGGRGSNGKNRILSMQPVALHQRLPLFLGSSEDMEELESYGDIQQQINPGYEV